MPPESNFSIPVAVVESVGMWAITHHSGASGHPHPERHIEVETCVLR